MQTQNIETPPNPFDITLEPKKSLTILLVSDIHNEHKKLDKLKIWFLQKFQSKVDYIFATGDFDTINNDIKASSSDPIQYEKITNILSFLEFAVVPVIYLPGNHDAAGLFKEYPKLTQHSEMLHIGSYQLAEGLQAVGVGGSSPAYIEKNGKQEQYWEGYPYLSENEIGKDLTSACEKYCNSNIQTIFLTHEGPYYCSTTIDTREPVDMVFSGSKTLNTLLKNPKYNFLVNIHGHTHAGTGRSNVNKVQVINPGSLKEGNFAILRLEKSEVSQTWIIKSTEFINLDAFY